MLFANHQISNEIRQVAEPTVPHYIKLIFEFEEKEFPAPRIRCHGIDQVLLTSARRVLLDITCLTSLKLIDCADPGKLGDFECAHCIATSPTFTDLLRALRLCEDMTDVIINWDAVGFWHRDIAPSDQQNLVSDKLLDAIRSMLQVRRYFFRMTNFARKPTTAQYAERGRSGQWDGVQMVQFHGERRGVLRLLLGEGR